VRVFKIILKIILLIIGVLLAAFVAFIGYVGYLKPLIFEWEIDAAMRAAMRPEGTCEYKSGGLECNLIQGKSSLELTRTAQGSGAVVVANLRQLGPNDPGFESLQPTFLAFWVRLGFTEHDVRSCLLLPRHSRDKVTIPQFMLTCHQEPGQWAGMAWGTSQFDLTRTP
jgi:hypothetical protein